MKTALFSILLSVTILAGCNNEGNNTDTEQNAEEIGSQIDQENTAIKSKGYELMTQKCFICHFQRPDPSRKGQMIAPPMLRVQEHYKPTYPNKADFVKSVIEYIHNPSLENTLMPGAVKKFRLMPKLMYDEKELQLIVEALYDTDFGEAPRMKGHRMNAGGMQLNQGEKWKLKPESIEQIDVVIERVTHFKSDNIEDYNQLGKDVFNDAKSIMLDDSYTGETFNNIHIFFSGIEGDMHLLMSVKSIDEAEIQLSELKEKLNDFKNYFE